MDRRFSAVMIFMYFSDEEDLRRPGMMRMEKRLASLRFPSADVAYKKFIDIGNASEFFPDPVSGTTFGLKFVGIKEMIEIGIENDEFEYWSEINFSRWPLTRRNSIPPKDKLRAFL